MGIGCTCNSCFTLLKEYSCVLRLWGSNHMAQCLFHRPMSCTGRCHHGWVGTLREGLFSFAYFGWTDDLDTHCKQLLVHQVMLDMRALQTDMTLTVITCVELPHFTCLICLNSGAERRGASYSGSRPLCSVKKEKQNNNFRTFVSPQCTWIANPCIQGTKLDKWQSKTYDLTKIFACAVTSRNTILHHSDVTQNVVFALSIVTDRIFSCQEMCCVSSLAYLAAFIALIDNSGLL